MMNVGAVNCVTLQDSLYGWMDRCWLLKLQEGAQHSDAQTQYRCRCCLSRFPVAALEYPGPSCFVHADCPAEAPLRVSVPYDIVKNFA